MSYINDALRKAQKDKDNRYEPFGGIIASSPGGPSRSRKRRAVLGAAAAMVILISVGLLFAVYGLQKPSARPKGALPPPLAAAENTAPPVAETAARPPDVLPEASPAKPVLDASAMVARASGAPPAAQPKGAAPATVAEKPAPKATEKAGRPQDRPPAAREADVRYQEALIAQRAGDLRRAEALYQKALELDPGHVRTLNNLGVIYMAQKKREKAIAVFGRAVVLKKDYVDPYYNLACLYAQTNEIDESLWYLKVAATIDGGVINWVKKDADMKNVVASPEFKKMMEGQKN